jgi:hypothetical protein
MLSESLLVQSGTRLASSLEIDGLQTNKLPISN